MAEASDRRGIKRRGIFGSGVVDRYFRSTTFLLALIVPALILVLAIVLGWNSSGAWFRFNWSFLTSSTWDPSNQEFHILFAIYGTVVSSFLALLIAVPLSLGAAISLSELAPRWLREPASFFIELLAAVPSIVYGLWGVFVLAPLLRPVEAWLGSHFPWIPLFSGSPRGIDMFAAGIILAIMILPYITSVSRDVIQAVPATQREAALALGATQWEAIRGPVFRYARSGIIGAIILGLGRALGETMAVTMVIGNMPNISASLFSPAYTMPSLLANQFNEASGMQLSALTLVALVLVVITIIINIIARLLIWSVSKGETRGAC
ncbi:MAG: phosphate ABC transporter permease subunit PstC [bacterium]